MNGYELMVSMSRREHSKIKPVAFIRRKGFISLMKLYKGLKCKLSHLAKTGNVNSKLFVDLRCKKEPDKKWELGQMAKASTSECSTRVQVQN